MINLVSYPRSGNTFFRNVLFEVYGIESAEYWSQGTRTAGECNVFQVVKTHHLPEELPDLLKNRKTVLLLRDGRDCVVSMAHHRKDIVEPGSDFVQNLNEVIEAAEGSHFGGWSLHTERWLSSANLVIRFEDLIRDPLGEVERLRAFMDMPAAESNRLPRFESLKTGQPKYGPNNNEKNKLFFRRGKVNGWIDEMAADQQIRFWHLHGELMEIAGYHATGSAPKSTRLFQEHFVPKAKPPKKVLIEASKVLEPFTDGIKRYVVELLIQAQKWPLHDLEIKALVDGVTLSVDEALALDGAYHPPSEDSWMWHIKRVLKFLLPNTIYRFGASLIKQIRWRKNVNDSVVKSLPEIESDILHLTLPQHYAHVDHVRAARMVGTIHDMTHQLYPQFHEEHNIQLTEEGMQWLSKKKASLISVSNQTARDLIAFGVESTVVSEGVDRRVFFPVNNTHLMTLVRDLYGLPQAKYLLSVSTLEPRKNLVGLIQAYSRLPHELRQEFPLVLAGRRGWKMNYNQIPTQCRSQVRFIGFVSENHLAALYTMASAFCYVSHYEGFGLPVLEAMACGCPVIVSGNSSLKEVVGDAGILVEPSSIESIRDGLMKICEFEHRRTEWSAKSLRRSWEFTWSKCWEKTVEVWRG